MEHRLKAQETNDFFQKAEPYLREIDYTHITQEERLRIIKSARFLDVRVRSEGREYYFEADFLKSLLDKIDDIQTRKILNEKITNEQQH